MKKNTKSTAVVIEAERRDAIDGKIPFVHYHGKVYHGKRFYCSFRATLREYRLVSRIRIELYDGSAIKRGDERAVGEAILAFEERMAKAVRTALKFNVR
jgi:hypothetical protein